MAARATGHHTVLVRLAHSACRREGVAVTRARSQMMCVPVLRYRFQRQPKPFDAMADWGQGVELVVLESPYRSLMSRYSNTSISAVRERQGLCTVVLPEFVPRVSGNHLLTSTCLAD